MQSAKPAPSPIDLATAPATFPARTRPDKDGKPRFVIAGDDGPSIRDGEKRRHVYCVGGVPVRIKIMRKDDNAMNVYRVTDTDGTTGWQYRKPESFAAAPYFTGRNPFDADPAQSLYWPEGEKDVDTVVKAGLLAFTFGGAGDGLPAGCEKYVADRHVVIFADNDDAGREHADKKAALVAPVAASVRVVHFNDLPNKGDVSDWIDAGHTADDLRARVDAAPVVEATYEPKMPHGYRFTEKGLLWLNPDDDDKPPTLIAGPFKILAETRDGDGGSWGLLLHWKDHDEREHHYALPRAMLAGDGSEARRALLDGGLFISPSPKARTLFNSFLLQVSIKKKARATQRVGWHDNSFVLPDDCFGADQREMLLLQSATAHEHSFRQKGSLQDWKDNVARYAVGNSRLVVAISAAFAGPLIGPCSAEGGGLHFRGASSTGKSTALFTAGSVWVVARSPGLFAPGAPPPTAWKEWHSVIPIRCCVSMSCRNSPRRKGAKPPICLETAPARVGHPGMDRRGVLPSGASCSSLRAKSALRTRSPRTVAAAGLPPANRCVSLIFRPMLAQAWECSRTCTSFHLPRCWRVICVPPLCKTMASLPANTLRRWFRT
jgi:hypothetical protein